MYCVSPELRDSWGQTVSQSESSFLKGMNREFYSTKPPLWDDDIRSMLAQTIGKEIPAVDVKSSKRIYDDDNATSSTKNENFSAQGPPKKFKFID